MAVGVDAVQLPQVTMAWGAGVVQMVESIHPYGHDVMACFYTGCSTAPHWSSKQKRRLKSDCDGRRRVDAGQGLC